ncbi:Maf family nucleotide pyrophosphatase [Gammaproteobacteria bacterium]|nr:Maf family nucleotide pyrophosphatase [Gammaproteobacteria bacterium]
MSFTQFVAGNCDLVLASGSPRRHDILDQIGVLHRIVIPLIDESQKHAEAAISYVSRLALEKANAGCLMQNLDVPVLGADTVLVSEGKVFGKPTDYLNFKDMFTALSGKTHSVLSAVALNNRIESLVLVSETQVTFRSIIEGEMIKYWDTGEPKDKAGGYAIQGYGSVFVEHIKGSYSGVVGLPIAETCRLLTEFNVPIWRSPIAE